MKHDESRPPMWRFSTDDWPECERAERLREEYGRALVKVEVESVDRELPLQVRATLMKLGQVGICTWKGSETRLERTRHLAAEGGDFLGFILNTGSTMGVTAQASDTELGTGEGVLLRAHDPAVITCASHLGLLIPSHELLARAPGVQDQVLRPVSRHSPALQLLTSYVRLCQSGVHLAPDVQAAAASHIIDLVALVIGSNHGDAAETGKLASASARLALVTDYLAKNFADAGLTLSSVARHHGISPRYLQKLLAQTGHSFTDHVNELRLNRALMLLGDQKLRHLRVSDVAFAVGFSDVSHFNRLFRARFGDTPRSFRVALSHL